MLIGVLIIAEKPRAEPAAGCHQLRCPRWRSAIGAYIGVVTGRLTLDLGIDRRTRPLGPLHLNIAAPRESVYAAAAAPCADRQTRAMREKIEILERAGQMVLAPPSDPV